MIPLRTWYQATSLVGVAGVSLDAMADGVVVQDLALGVGSAHSRARVDAFLMRTRLVERAVIVGGALRTTADDRVALVLRNAAADRHARVVATLCVRAARRWLTGLGLRLENSWSRWTSCGTTT